MNQSLGTLFVSEIVMAEVWGKYPAGHDHELVVLAARPNKSHQEMQENARNVCSLDLVIL